MKPMLLTSAEEIPTGKKWLYETKYDGFRCILKWESEIPSLISRNGKALNQMFPEIVEFCSSIYSKVRPYLPLTLDGELVHLVNDHQSQFSAVQTRGRMRTAASIQKHVKQYPCHYVVFDLLELKGEKLGNWPTSKRKQKLKKLFESASLPEMVDYTNDKRLQAIEASTDSEELWKRIVACNGEGLIAKEKSSEWESGKRTSQWLKIKNWRFVTVIVTKFEKTNGYFNGAVYREGILIEIVNFRHGMKEEEYATLAALFQNNGKMISEEIWELEPSVCVDIACIDFDGKHLREPRFNAFVFDKESADCNWQHMLRQLHPIPEAVAVTHPDKPVWPKSGIQKDDYLFYLQSIAPHMMPFLRDRVLTVIRFPHGAPGESFYQKNSPDTTPDFVATKVIEDIRYIVCNNDETLLWLGNQLALEFHIPFQTIHTEMPTEIVFDLDPPSVEHFSLAIEAALRMKAIFDQFGLQSFVKTSGGKGLQIYIPLPYDTFSYEETRVFTKFVCTFLCEQEPQWFTTERLKKNRHNKLYLDYVQHHEGKTIIAPYSTRGNEKGLVATPLAWEEVNSSLSPALFTIPAVLERIANYGNPFRGFRGAIEEQKFKDILSQLQELVGEE